MFANRMRYLQPHLRKNGKLLMGTSNVQHSILGPEENIDVRVPDKTATVVGFTEDNPIKGEIPNSKVVPMVVTHKEAMVLSFDQVPGPKSLKYFSNVRQYLSEVGTQVTAGIITLGLNIGTILYKGKPLQSLSTLFEDYGPVVRFISPVGRDIVLLSHPDHIQKVYAMEGDCPVRSTLDSLEKYRASRRSQVFNGLFTVQGQDWTRQRSLVYNPLHSSVSEQVTGINEICENLVQKLYNLRNYQDEVPKDLYTELHKWAFDCMGLIVFAKKFNMVETDQVHNQCDMSWMYHNLDKATDAILKCESGLHLWRLFATPAWNSLVKHCDNLDNLIGKHVLEAEQFQTDDIKRDKAALINALLLGEDKLPPEDITTVLMDVLLIGVNTITSSASFLLYYLSKYQRSQKLLYQEIQSKYPTLNLENMQKFREETPYLQACIKETLRLVPPIPLLTRILPKNIILDRYNIPKGTLIIMSTQDSSLKEGNYEDALKFYPDRWFKPDAKDYHSFASVPFGYGIRKCVGQNVAETMLSLLVAKLVQKYKLEYHYGDISPTRSFIAKPNKTLKIRFVDRV